MSDFQSKADSFESLLVSTLQNNDHTMDEFMAQWTHGADCEVPGSGEPAWGSGHRDAPNGASDTRTSDYPLAENDTFDSLFHSQDDSSPTTAGAQELPSAQVNVPPYSGVPSHGRPTSQNPIAHDDLFNDHFDWASCSPPATAGAQELPPPQVNVSPYPENPSPTTGSWLSVWVPRLDTSPTSHSYPDPSLNGTNNVPIDPALLALDAPCPSISAISPRVPDTDLWDPSYDPTAEEPAPSPSPAPILPSRKRKRAATTSDTRITKRAKPALPKTTLSAPLSTLTASSRIPLADVLSHIQRPASARKSDAAYSRNRKNQAIPRPLNSFMLYKMAYVDRISAYYCNHGSGSSKNHGTISSVAGQSWRMETEEVKGEFARLAEMEKEAHEKAWPDYRYRPRMRIQVEDVDGDASQGL